MVNQFRTLLMNAASAPVVPQNTGEEYIDPAFVPVMEHEALGAVRRLLFGATPDRFMLNYRMAQFMQLLHGSELAPLVYALDPRITYLRPVTQATVFTAASTYTPTVLYRTATDPVIISGTPASPDAHGITQYTLTVTQAGSDVAVTTVIPPQGTSEATQTFNFAPTGYTIALPPQDGTWLLSFTLRPTWDLGALAAGIATLDVATYLALYGYDNAEPYASLRAMQTDRNDLVAQLGTALVALAYRNSSLARGAA